MDFHFVKPKHSSKHNNSGNSSFSKIVRLFLPVFILSAMLPFLIGFVVTPPNISFFTRADSEANLRIWVEPANVVLSPGSQFTFTVMGNFDSDGKIIPEITFEATGNGPVRVNNPIITHSVPFNGRTELGKISVTALESGSAQVSIIEESINITALDIPINITTAATNITVR